MNEQIIFLTFFLFFSFNYSTQGSETPKVNDLFNLSLTELMNIEISSGTLTNISTSKIPVARTVITADQIATTPARTILDLIEIYVPGATFVETWGATSQIGMRGILGDQNNAFLCLVNGQNTNLKAAQGIMAEINNRDLSDIETIEIIRGPGSVTYGPGAIGGIINITIKDANSLKGIQAGVDANTIYRYGNGHVSYGHVGENFKWSIYSSYNQSEGEEKTGWFYIDRAHNWGQGYMSPEWGGLNGTGTSAPKMYGDYDNHPQAKVHLTFESGDYNFWARYTSYSKVNTFMEVKTVDGYRVGGLYGKTLTAALENKHKFSVNSSIATTLAFDSHSRKVKNSLSRTKTFDDPEQTANSYAENEINLKSIYNLVFNGYKFAIGGQISHEYWRPEWGDKDDTFVMNSPAGDIYLTDSSPRYRSKGTGNIINNLENTTHSLFGEANLDFHKYATILLSGRYDKTKYAKSVISPRIAIISEINSSNIVKAIWQQSLRLPNFSDMYVERKIYSGTSKPEKITNYELMYNYLHGKNTHLALSTFYNIIDQLTWNYDVLKTDIEGRFKLLGFEADAVYKKPSFLIGTSYSYINQISWRPKTIPTWTLTNLDSGSMPLNDYGDNRINNLPAHTIKGYFNKSWTDTISSHLNGRIFWGFGQRSMLDMYMDSWNRYGDQAGKAEMQNIYDTLRDNGYGKLSFTLNASIKWKLPTKTKATLSLYGMNILSYNHIRYYHQWWGYASKQYPRAVSFIDEPISVGFKLDIAI